MKKGFTLIELLAVIVILSIIALIATPTILGIIKDSKEEANKRSIEMYAKAVENAITVQQLTSNEKIIGSFVTKNGKDLMLLGNPKLNIKVDYDGNVVCETIEIDDNGKLYLAQCQVNNIIVNYTYNEKYICKAVEDKTTPNKPPYTGYNPGDAYDCEVKPGIWYRFYVLSTDDKNVNLIAQQNITFSGELTSEPQTGDEWYAPIANKNYGPQTAYMYLSESTNDWINVPIIKKFTYVNEEYKNSHYGYKGIITNIDEETINYITTITPFSSQYGDSKLYENLRVRLPYKSEVTENTNCSSETNVFCPLWMVNYLARNENYSTEDGKIDSNEQNNGYWLLETYSGNTISAFSIGKQGFIGIASVNAPGIGIRPVITIPKINLYREI